MAVAGTGRTPAVAAALPRRQPGRVLLPEASCRQPRRRCACDRAAAEARARAVPVRRLVRGRDRPGADEHAGIPPLLRAHRRPAPSRPFCFRPLSLRRRPLAGYVVLPARDARLSAARLTSLLCAPVLL